jgi:pimeloyl-ACP methyl ester carboxylesterase
LSVPDQIRADGLKFESHSVTTTDGYILDLWHVYSDDVEPAINEETGERKVAFMQHGLLDIAGTWWFNTPQDSVAATLAKKGWSMWLGNNRGTTNSYKHLMYTVDDDEYWNYSFNEMGKYDLPANLDYVLKETGVSKITYMGHS